MRPRDSTARASIALASMGLCLAACNQKADQAAANRSSGTTAEHRADNTSRNQVNRDSQTKTPLDQSNTSADTKVTAGIRRAVMDDSTLSTNAHNCKIITDKAGVVTLRGPVDSQTEKDLVEAKAIAVAGVNQVVNELEVIQK